MWQKPGRGGRNIASVSFSGRPWASSEFAAGWRGEVVTSKEVNDAWGEVVSKRSKNQPRKIQARNSDATLETIAVRRPSYGMADGGRLPDCAEACSEALLERE